MSLAAAFATPTPIALPMSESESDYDHVRRAVEYISEQWREQPSLETIAEAVGMRPLALQRLFTRWAGLSPKAFLQAVTLDHAKRLLRQEELPLLETSFEVGLSGPSRLHDLFVTHEAMSPREWKAGGEGLKLASWHQAIDDSRCLDGAETLRLTAPAPLARISPATAAALGVRDGEPVMIGTDSGEVVLPAAVTASMSSGPIQASLGVSNVATARAWRSGTDERTAKPG